MMDKDTKVFLLAEPLSPCRHTMHQMQHIAKKEIPQQ